MKKVGAMMSSSLLVWLPALAAAIDCTANPSSTEPQAVHLAYSGPPSSSIAVSFLTCSSGPNGSYPVVTLLDGGTVFRGTSSSYLTRHHHDGLLTGLSPDTRYSYRVGLRCPASPSICNMSSAFEFSTSPADDAASNFTAFVIGDVRIRRSNRAPP